MKLHIGCGKNYIEGWINADLKSKAADIEFDAREKLPYEDNTVSYIFNEHFIEHITQAEGFYFLSECYRILKPKGILRISTPNLWHCVEIYTRGHIHESWADTPCEFLNGAMRKWGHQFVYDSNQLASALVKVGFKNVYPCLYRKSNDVNLESLESREFNNELIFEALK